jgi:hypothetical protein
MANKLSPITNEWMVVDKSREAWRRVTMLSAAVAVSAVLWIFLGSLLLAVGTRDAAAGRDLAHEFHKSPLASRLPGGSTSRGSAGSLPPRARTAVVQ